MLTKHITYKVVCDHCGQDLYFDGKNNTRLKIEKYLRKKEWMININKFMCSDCNQNRTLRKVLNIPLEEIKNHTIRSLAKELDANIETIKSIVYKKKLPVIRQQKIDWEEITEGYNDRYNKNFTHEQMLIHLYEELGSTMKMERILGVTPATIRVELKKFGVKFDKNNNNRKKQIDFDNILKEYNKKCNNYYKKAITIEEAIKNTYEKTDSLRQTANILKMSMYMVRRKIKESKIELVKNGKNIVIK